MRLPDWFIDRNMLSSKAQALLTPRTQAGPRRRPETLCAVEREAEFDLAFHARLERSPVLHQMPVPHLERPSLTMKCKSTPLLAGVAIATHDPKAILSSLYEHALPRARQRFAKVDDALHTIMVGQSQIDS